MLDPSWSWHLHPRRTAKIRHTPSTPVLVGKYFKACTVPSSGTMFSTFAASIPAGRPDDTDNATAQGKHAGQKGHSSDNISPLSSSPSAPAPRPKRNQVARACEWCRLNRIKCDNDQPCFNCKSRGTQCYTTGKSEVRSLSSANKQVPPMY